MARTNTRQTAQPAITVELGMHFVDAVTCELAPVSTQILARFAGSQTKLRPSVLRSSLALSAGPFTSLDELEAALHAGLDEVRLAAGAANANVFLASSFPLASDLDALMDPQVRTHMLRHRKDLLQRQLVQGLTIALRLPTEDAAQRARDALAHQLPLLLALSASSPFWAGRDTGYASARIELLDLGVSGELPQSPRDSDRVLTPRDLWFDLRAGTDPTVTEVRICDVPHTVGEVVTLAALAQQFADDAQSAPQQPPPPWASWVRNRREALQHGLDAVLVDGAGVQRTARAQALELAQWVPPRLAAGLKLILSHGNGATRQRASFQASGDLEKVVAAVVGELDVNRDTPDPDTN